MSRIPALQKDRPLNITLVFPPFYLRPMYNLPPLGLVSIATMLKDSPHRVSILDFPLAIRRKSLTMGRRIYEDCTSRILEHEPDLVGFSVQCTTYPAAVQIAKRLKERKQGLGIVFGGHSASFVDDRTLSAFPWIDAIIRGEGEITFRELVSAYSRGSDGQGIPGVTFRSNGAVIRNEDRELIKDLDDLPLADYSLVPPLSEYRDACNIPRSIAILEVGRGCPHRCIYCSQSLMWRRRTRTFSVDRLIREMRHLVDGFGAECFLLAYDQFTTDRSFVEEFCRGVIEAELHRFPWYCISRLDSVDLPLLKMMRQAGCESMCYGIDSGSRKTLAFIRKNIDYDILYQRVQETTEQGIVPTLSFVIGFPEEEREDIDATLTLALRTGIQGNVNPLVQMTTILHGTDLFLRYSDRLVREVDTYFSLGLEFDDGKRLSSDEELINSDPIIFCSFYNLPCPAGALQDLNLIASYFHLLASFFPASFLLLAMDLRKSVSVLCLEWLHWLQHHTGRPVPQMLPQDCRNHFAEFALEKLQESTSHAFVHLPDVLRYEGLCIEAGGAAGECDTDFHIDFSAMRESKPLRNEKVILGEFPFNIPDIILDLKAGVFRDSYPKQETFLVFRQERERLHVTEINDFGRDFLNLCDGRKNLEAISRELYPHYGAGMAPSDFYSSCVEAAEVLGQMKLLRVWRSETDQERR